MGRCFLHVVKTPGYCYCPSTFRPPPFAFKPPLPFHLSHLPKLTHNSAHLCLLSPAHPRFLCDAKSQMDVTRILELEKPREAIKPIKSVNGVYWIILANLAIFVADHCLQIPGVKSLYFYHDSPAWYQFVTSTFCHNTWQHLSGNLFFVYIFGKLVEEEEGNFGLWFSYFVTGAGANLVSWFVLPRASVSTGASGAVFGLFAISVLVKITLDWRKFLEVLILGQFVIEKVMEAAKASAAMTTLGGVDVSLQVVNHIAHLSGALIGVLLVWFLSIISSPSDSDSSLKTK